MENKNITPEETLITDKRIKKMLSLSPKQDSENEEVYRPYLDAALEEKIYEGSTQKRNKNIALSGEYGTGKSSIIRTYINNSNYKDKTLYVSLSSYIEDGDNNNNNQKELEVSILQQIIYAEEPHNLPNSRIKRIDKNKKVELLKSIFTSLIITTITSYIFVYIMKEKLDKYFSDNNILLLLFLILIILIFILLSMIVYYLRMNFYIHTVTLGNENIKAETKKTQEGTEPLSPLNIYRDELIYFFKNTNYEIVVFEDIDRLDKSKLLFSKLKETNEIINIALHNKKTVHFIYAVKDTLFEDDSEKRTKFFDIIIPIVPLVSYSTAKNQLIKSFQEIGEEIQLADARTIGSYITNPRLIFDIVNEYQIYAEHNKTILTPKVKRELMYLSAYKVLFPEKFNKLYTEDSIISYFITNSFKEAAVEKVREERKKEIEKEQQKVKEELTIERKKWTEKFITALTDEYNFMKNVKTTFYSKEDVPLITLDELNSNYENFQLLLSNENVYAKCSGHATRTETEIFGKYGKENYIEKYNNIDLINKINILEIKKDIASKETITYDSISTSDIITIAEVLYKENIDSKENTNKKEQKKDIVFENYEKTMITQGCFNDTTKSLITKRFDNILNDQDQKTLNKITRLEKVEWDTPISDAKEMLNEIFIQDFHNDSFCLKDLYIEILNKSNFDEYLKIFYENLSVNKIHFIENLERNNVPLLKNSEKYFGKLWNYIGKLDYSGEVLQKGDLLISTLKYDVSSLRNNSYFTELIFNNQESLSYLNTSLDDVKENLKKMHLKFNKKIDFTKGNYSELVLFVYDNNLFSNCYNHISSICKVKEYSFDNNKILESVFSNNEENIKNAIILDFNTTLEWIKELNIPQDDCESFIINFTNQHGPKLSDFEAWIELEKCTFEDVSNLGEEYIRILAKNNKLKGTLNNLQSLFNAKGKTIDEDVALFMTTNKESLVKEDFTSDLYKELCHKFVRSDKFEKEDFAYLNKTIMRAKWYSSIDNFKIDSLKTLIKDGNIIIDKTEEYTKVLSNEELTIDEKVKVLIDSIDKLKDTNIPNLSKEIVTKLLNSNISSQTKVDFMSSNEEYIIDENKNILFDIMLREKVNFEPALILSMFETTKSENEKIQLYLTYEDDILSEYDVKTVLRKMSGTFDRIVNEEPNTFLDNTPDNMAFINRLKEHGLINRGVSKINKIQIAYKEPRQDHTK